MALDANPDAAEQPNPGPEREAVAGIVTNYYLPDKGLAVLVEVGVDYDSDLAKVEQITCQAANITLQTVSGGAAEFKPFIRYHTFGESSINFTVILRAREYVDQYLLKHEFIKRLHERYRREQITIPFSIRTIVMRPPNAVSSDAMFERARPDLDPRYSNHS